MKAKGRIVSMFMAVATVLALMGCVPGTQVISPKYNLDAASKSQLAMLSPVKIKLVNFVDQREGKVEPILVGRLQAAFGVPMGDVQANRPVFTIISDALKAELTGAGHTIVDQNPDIELSSEIHKFWIGTDVTALYWDVYGEIELMFTINNKKTGVSSKVGPFAASNVERTYTNPGVDIMERVIDMSLGQVVEEMAADPVMQKAMAVD